MPGRWARNCCRSSTRGAAALIADMTATLSCDHSGADAVVRAYQRALVSGAQLRLVVTAPAVRRALSVNGLDRLISIYPSPDAAIAAGRQPPPPATRRLHLLVRRRDTPRDLLPGRAKGSPARGGTGRTLLSGD